MSKKTEIVMLHDLCKYASSSLICEQKQQTKMGEFVSLETEKVFIASPVQFQCLARILKSTKLDTAVKGFQHVIVLDRTVFHPQGGGQPADRGMIVASARPSVKYLVGHVQANGNCIEHYGKFCCDDGTATFDDFLDGEEVSADIDVDWRTKCFQLHSAGHLVDAAVKSCGLLDKMRPTKGYHFPDGPYVQFSGSLTEEELKEFPIRANELLQELIANSIPSETLSMMKEQAVDLCTHMDLTGYPDSLRIVQLGGVYTPCGGTHVSSTSELSALRITKIAQKKGVIKVSYSLEN